MPTRTVKKKRTQADDRPENIKAFDSFGLNFTDETGSDWKAECPFCGGAAFHVNQKEGTYHCKTCPVHGNKYTFMQAWYDLWFKKTTSRDFKKLEEDRGLPWEQFELQEFAYDKTNGVWLVPIRNAKSSMVNLGRWNKDRPINGHRPVMMAGGCKTHLGCAERISDNPKVWICEGIWDVVAAEWLLAQNKIKDTAVVWVPGSQSFKEEWAIEHCFGREIVLLYDNDDPGSLGMEKAAELIRLHGKPKSISKIKWPESFPEKFDLRDYVLKNLKKPKGAYKELLGMIEEVHFKKPKTHTIERTTFEEIVQDFREKIHVTDEFIDGLLISFSVIFSSKIFNDPYCPLWMYIIAPPGKGKTLIFQTTSDSEQVEFQTTLTPATLVSGFKTPDGSDPSLLPKIIGKTLVIEDFTGIMNLPAGEQDEIYGILRSAYNGRYEKQFGHIGLRQYPEPGSEHETCHFTILAGCTGAIHADKRANQGERFLKYHMSSPDFDPVPQVRSAISNTVNEVTPEILLREPVSAFIDYKLANTKPPAVVPTWIEEKLIGLAQIVATVRAVVLRSRGELVTRPEAEVATRISKQLVKLGQAVAFTLNKDEVDKECYRIMQRVGMDTCYGWARDAISAIVCCEDEYVKTEVVSGIARMSRTTTFRNLEDLLELGVVSFDLEDTGRKGKPAHLWYLNPQIKELWERSEIDAKSLLHTPAGVNFKARARLQKDKEGRYSVAKHKKITHDKQAKEEQREKVLSSRKKTPIPSSRTRSKLVKKKVRGTVVATRRVAKKKNSR